MEPGIEAGSGDQLSTPPGSGGQPSTPAMSSSSAMPKLPARPPKKVRPPSSEPASTPASAAPEGSSEGASAVPSASGGTFSSAPTSARAGKSSFMPTLPPRQVMPKSGPILDPGDSEEVVHVRKLIHSIRVSLVRAARRLGYDQDNGLVKQVMYRLNLAEKLKAPWKRARRMDPGTVAARDASRLEEELGPAAPLDFTIKMMIIGLTGTGKTQLIHSLLEAGPEPGAPADSWQPAPAVDPFEGGTKRVEVSKGTVHGIPFVCIDTPGLLSCASGMVANAKVLRQIRKAYQQHKPDLVIYVDRLDASVRTAGEMPALQGLSEALGPQVWLNTIVALTHAGSTPPCGAKGRLPFDVYANQKSHLLQQVIRHASGDARLMNPTAFVECHPDSKRDGAGQPLLANGMGWKSHLYLMIISAKLLAATESLLQMKEDGSSGSNMPLPGTKQHQRMMMQMMMGEGARSLPLPYLTAAATQFSRPIMYPNHEAIMEVRQLIDRAEAEVKCRKDEKKRRRSKLMPLDPKEQRDLQYQISGRLRRMRQLAAEVEKMKSASANTVAGGKISPETPSFRRTPSAQPPSQWRYRVPEVATGWIVRPNIEPHAMEHTDGIEGLTVERKGVYVHRGVGAGWGRKKDRQKGVRLGRKQILGGVPYHHSLMAQVCKERRALQASTEATLYHDQKGNLKSSLSFDAQSSSVGPFGMGDMLCTARCNVSRHGTLFRGNEVTGGLILSRLAEDGVLLTGPVAMGMRLQDSVAGEFGPLPLHFDASLAYLSTVPPLSSHSDLSVTELEGSFGGNMEMAMDLQEVLHTHYSLPVTIDMNTVSYKGKAMHSLAASVQTKLSEQDMLAVRLKASNHNRAGISLKFKSTRSYWMGVLAMLVPLTTLLLETVGIIKA